MPCTWIHINSIESASDSWIACKSVASFPKTLESSFLQSQGLGFNMSRYRWVVIYWPIVNHEPLSLSTWWSCCEPLPHAKGKAKSDLQNPFSPMMLWSFQGTWETEQINYRFTSCSNKKHNSGYSAAIPLKVPRISPFVVDGKATWCLATIWINVCMVEGIALSLPFAMTN